MLSSEQRERRVTSRRDYVVRVNIQSSPQIASHDDPAAAHGETRNITPHGMCVSLDQSCDLASVFRCEIFFPDTSVSIPTLGYTRWIQATVDGKYFIGIEFLV